MKRLIIFAAMLLTLSLSSTAADDEPSVRRNPEEIVLIGKTVITPQRSIVYCEFVYDPETLTIDISCFGTGATEFTITDSYGHEVDSVTADTGTCTQISMSIPAYADTYLIIVESDTYYGYGTVTVE